MLTAIKRFLKAKELPEDDEPESSAPCKRGDIFVLKTARSDSNPFPQPMNLHVAVILGYKAGWVRYRLGYGLAGVERKEKPWEEFLKFYKPLNVPLEGAPRPLVSSDE